MYLMSCAREKKQKDLRQLFFANPTHIHTKTEGNSKASITANFLSYKLNIWNCVPLTILVADIVSLLKSTCKVD